MFHLCENPLDVSLMTIQDKFYSVLAVSGDAHLEGRDFDLQLMEFRLERFDPTGRTRMENLHSPKLKVLKSQCKVAKHEFASSERAMVYIEELQIDEDLDIRITRMEFEATCQNLFARILGTVEEALEYIDEMFQDIDEVIMIDESSATRAIQRIIGNYISKPPFSEVPPLEAAARGVTVLVAVFSANDNVPGMTHVNCR
jgi:molecular chaperone DnaK (HSP70)